MVDTAMNADSVATPARPRKRDLYQRVWRWHFFAGIFVIPFAIILAVTGGVYLFKAQIEGAVEVDINARAVIDEAAISADTLLARVQGSYLSGCGTQASYPLETRRPNN